MAFFLACCYSVDVIKLQNGLQKLSLGLMIVFSDIKS